MYWWLNSQVDLHGMWRLPCICIGYVLCIMYYVYAYMAHFDSCCNIAVEVSPPDNTLNIWVEGMSLCCKRWYRWLDTCRPSRDLVRTVCLARILDCCMCRWLRDASLLHHISVYVTIALQLWLLCWLTRFFIRFGGHCRRSIEQQCCKQATDNCLLGCKYESERSHILCLVSSWMSKNDQEIRIRPL